MTDGPLELPVRPDLLPAWSRRERRWWPLAAVLAVIAFVVYGGYLTTAALSEAAGPPIVIPGIVEVRPLSGWQVSRSGLVPLAIGGEGQLEQLTRGPGNLAIVAVHVGAVQPQRLAEAYADGELRARLDQPTVSQVIREVTLSGAHAVRFRYVGVFAASGVSVEGEVTLLVTPGGDGVIFDAFAPEGILQFILGDVHAMESRAGFFA